MSLISEAIDQEMDCIKDRVNIEVQEERERWNKAYDDFKEKEGKIVNTLRRLGVDQHLETADIPQGSSIPKLIQVKFTWKFDRNHAAITVCVEHDCGVWRVRAGQLEVQSEQTQESLKSVIAKCIAETHFKRLSSCW